MDKLTLVDNQVLNYKSVLKRPDPYGPGRYVTKIDRLDKQVHVRAVVVVQHAGDPAHFDPVD